jgi:hypothetical protein
MCGATNLLALYAFLEQAGEKLPLVVVDFNRKPHKAGGVIVSAVQQEPTFRVRLIIDILSMLHLWGRDT